LNENKKRIQLTCSWHYAFQKQPQ